MKPRFRAEWVVFQEIFWSLASCCLSPMKRNSVFKELRVKRLEVTQEEICCRAPWRYVMLECTSRGWKEKKSCVSSAYRWWFRERDEMSELRGSDVYLVLVLVLELYSSTSLRYLYLYLRLGYLYSYLYLRVLVLVTSLLRGVVYMIKRRGRRTEPCGTPQNTYGERRNYFRISHGKDERTDKIWASQGQCQLFQTTRKDETIKCYGQ